MRWLHTISKVGVYYCSSVKCNVLWTCADILWPRWHPWSVSEWFQLIQQCFEYYWLLQSIYKTFLVFSKSTVQIAIRTTCKVTANLAAGVCQKTLLSCLTANSLLPKLTYSPSRSLLHSLSSHTVTAIGHVTHLYLLHLPITSSVAWSCFVGLLMLEVTCLIASPIFPEISFVC